MYTILLFSKSLYGKKILKLGLTSSLNLNLQLKFEEQNLKINIYKNGICLKTIKMFIYHLTTFCVMIFKRKSNL